MKLLRRVSRLDVKRCFVMTPFMRKFGIAGRYDTKPPTRTKYLAALKKAKRAVMKLTEKQLDRHIEHPKRLRSYNKARWFTAVLTPRELGVWKKAGGLPLPWTRRSLAETAKRVAAGLRINDTKIQKRAKRAIPAIIQLQHIIKKEPYLFPIVFESGFGTNGRKGLPKMKADIDDGCMRSIALAIGGAKKLSVYIGLPPKS